jgi:hypothetical protein
MAHLEAESGCGCGGADLYPAMLGS